MKKTIETQKILKILTQVLDANKAENITVIPMHESMSALADYFIIATALNTRHVKALADHLIIAAKKAGHTAASLEGETHSGWGLIDLNSIIIHLFTEDQRQYYDLESLWASTP